MQPPGPERAIIGFECDDDAVWVALLECGHRQHVRHRPPIENRFWTQSQEGRERHVGTKLPCHYCLMPALPDGAVVYKETAWFDETSIPGGLLGSHRLAPGTWGRIVVREGILVYVIEREPELVFILNPRLSGTVQPEQPHRVEARGAVVFRVEFLTIE